MKKRPGLADVAWREYRVTKQIRGQISLLDAVMAPGWFWYWELGFGANSDGPNLRATLENLKEINRVNRGMLDRKATAPRASAMSKENREKRLAKLARRAKKLIRGYQDGMSLKANA